MSLSNINVNDQHILSITQEPGHSTDAVMSQKGTTDVFSNNILVELYINPNVYPNVSKVYISKGSKIYGDRDEWYEGIYLELTNGNYILSTLIKHTTSAQDAFNACVGTKIYSNSNRSIVAVVKWENHYKDNDDIIIDISCNNAGYNTFDKKPIITNFFNNNLIKEFYISPDVANVSDITHIYVDKAYHPNADSVYYTGAYIVLTNGTIIWCTRQYTSEQGTEARAECVGQKIYYNAAKTAFVVIDWDESLIMGDIADGYEWDFPAKPDYNTYVNKPIISGYLTGNNSGVKELYILQNKLQGTLTAIYIAKGFQMYQSVEQYYSGIYFALSTGWIFDCCNIFDTRDEALAECVGQKIYHTQNNSIVAVINWDECVSNVQLAISADYYNLKDKPIINNYLASSVNPFKELYISPSVAAYSDIQYVRLVKANKMYSAYDKWYNGFYLEILVNDNVRYVIVTRDYDSQQDAYNECVGQKVYHNSENTTVAIIDWDAFNRADGDYLFPSKPDYNSLDNKPIISGYLASRDTDPAYCDAWINRYPELLKNLPVFSNKIYNHAEDVNVLMLGDSLFEAQITCPLNYNAANLPPQCARRHTQYHIWNRLCFNKPQYDRYDSQVNPITETGTFSESGEVFPTIWDVGPDAKTQAKNTGVTLNKYSADTNAGISFSWDMSAHEKLNFIYRKSNNMAQDAAVNTLGTSAAVVAISGGNGKTQVYNGTSWVEANGFTFSMRIAESGDGYAVTMPDVKLKFRKVTTDTITVSITNQANDGLFYYWGTERWNGQSLFITNIARGGFNCSMHQQNIINDIGDRDCDLLIYELPLTNDSYRALSTIRSSLVSIIEGSTDAAWREVANFKALSDNFTKFDLLCIIPHIGTRYIFENSDVFKPKANEPQMTYKQYFDDIRGLMESHELNYIPLYKVWLDSSRDQYDNYYNAGDAREHDTVHPNELGCLVYAKTIEPAIEI